MTKEMTACIRPGRDPEVSGIFLRPEDETGGRKPPALPGAALCAGHRGWEVYPQEQEGELLLVQGIIDVWFEEEDGLVVLDYKTDQVDSPEELTEKYHAQLDYYARALERLTGKKSKRKDHLFLYAETGDKASIEQKAGRCRSSCLCFFTDTC